ncbi:MAG: methyltransferase domain-containing protein [Actinomycetota bacterium]
MLDEFERVRSVSLSGRRVLDLAAGTGTVSIEAARRGAAVIGVDLTDELLDVARRRADEAEVEVHFVVGDIDRLDDVIEGDSFDVITSAFGLMFAPDALATLSSLRARLVPDGVVAVSAWDPDGSLMVPASMIELFPEVPPMLDMSTWSTRVAELADAAGFEVASTVVDDLRIPFESVDHAAEQLERWAGGWTQLLERFDELGVGAEARRRFRDHLAAFSTPAANGLVLCAYHHVSVLCPA